MAVKCTKWTYVRYTNIFLCKPLQNLPKFTKIWIFVLKIYHVSTLFESQFFVHFSGDYSEEVLGIFGTFFLTKDVLTICKCSNYDVLCSKIDVLKRDVMTRSFLLSFTHIYIFLAHIHMYMYICITINVLTTELYWSFSLPIKYLSRIMAMSSWVIKKMFLFDR
jgi:hypothetical protein